MVHGTTLLYQLKEIAYGVEQFDDVSRRRGRDQDRRIEKRTKFVV